MTLGRRGLLQAAAAVAAMGGNAFAQRRQPTQGDLLAFKATGQLTLLNFTDLHAQLMPVYFREPSVNIGVGSDRGLPPHIVGEKLLAAYKVGRNSLDAYALACTDFEDLARTYGRLGGLDRLSTLIKAIRAERGSDRVLLLDGGDSWQGSYSALQTKGADMVKVISALKPDAMTGHWEFTYGQQRVQELIKQLEFPFLAGNVKDATWGDPVFQASSVFAGLSVLENVRLAAQARLGGSMRPWQLVHRGDAAHDVAARSLQRVGLARRGGVLAGALSHGDKRKLELAILLATDPAVVLLDEPMAGVSIEVVAGLTEVIAGVHRDEGRTVLMVEHHMDVLLGLADRVAVMHHGRLLALDTPERVTSDPAVQQAYLGEGL